jgi:hypothetical protein
MYQNFYSGSGILTQRKYPPLNLIVYQDSTRSKKAYFLLVSSQNEQNLNNENWLKSFTGQLIYYSLSGEVSDIKSFVNGRGYYSAQEGSKGTNQAARCALMWECFYTGASPNLMEVWGHYSISSNPCNTALNINGRPYTLTGSGQVYGCADDVSNPHEPAPPVLISGGGPGTTPNENPSIETGSNPSESAAEPAIKRGIDCNTFDFTKTAGNWQEAGVQGFRFRYYDQISLQYQVFTMRRVLVVGYPIERADGTIYSPGAAAAMAANAFQNASDKAFTHWQSNTWMNAYQVETLFNSWLRASIEANGGRLQFKGTTSGVIINTPQYVFMGNGECQ